MVQIVVEICILTVGLWVVSFVDLGLWCMLISGFVVCMEDENLGLSFVFFVFGFKA